MFFYFSSEKVIKMTVIMLVLMASVFAILHFNEKWEINSAIKLYASKIRTDTSYWISHKLAGAINPKEPSFFLWKVAGYQNEDEPNISLKKARSLPVLTYHGLPNEGIGQIPNDIFVEQLKILKDNGWNTITLEEFNLFIKNQTKLPEKSFLLTFDDGRKDAFYPVDPVLRDLGFNAVIFVITKRSISEEDSSYYLSSYELRQLEKADRWEVESHGRDSHDWYYIDDSGTLGHYFSDKFWIEKENRMETDEEYRDRIIYDLSTSKKELEDSLSKTVSAIAYPFGDFGQESINYHESAIIVENEAARLYELGFYQTRRGVTETFNYPENQFMIKRIEPTAQWSGEYLLAILESGMPKDLPYEASTFSHEWRSAWGETETGESLKLKASKNSTGSSAMLNGSYLWENYTFTAEVNWQEGSNIVLIARQDKDGNYFGCNFGPGNISIKSYTDKISRNLIKKSYSIGKSLDNKLSLGIEAVGNNISCLVNGEKIIEGKEINTTNPNGNVGFEVWDERSGKASAIFDNVSVIEH